MQKEAWYAVGAQADASLVEHKQQGKSSIFAAKPELLANILVALGWMRN